MSPSGPVLDRTLSAFDGLWVDIYKPGVEIVLPRPTARNAQARRASTGGAPTPIQRPRPPIDTVHPTSNWHIRLIAESADMRDAGNVFGQAEGSLDGYDHRDLVELTPFGSPYLTVVFPHAGWSATGDDFATDIRARRRDGSGEWDFAVRWAGTEEPITLSWEGPRGALKAAVLIDVATGQQVATGADGSYTFEPSGSERQFRWQQYSW